ncbi:MAG: hypothetical protein ACJ736_16565 [Streptomyces sp.]|jgi:hypothetical protein
MTNQQRMRALLDQRAQQTKRRDQQASSETSKAVLKRWTGPKRGGSMRGRRSGA